MEESPLKKHLLAGLLTMLFVLAVLIIGIVYFLTLPPNKTWEFQSIDTMKVSRDLAREKLFDESFDATISAQMEDIAKTGATHVSIATPYDKEFLPILKRWVIAARKENLNVWFRGNLSGWEGWFGYPKITRDEHTELVENFILQNSSLFEDGDVFTSCPECENGGPGDPRKTQDVKGHRQFLINEYNITKKAFNRIEKRVKANVYSMNYDVAKLIMDPSTTKSLDGIVTIDHYVATPQQLNNDINFIAQQSMGKVILGEIGTPIPDIHGIQTEDQQSQWMLEALDLLSKNKNVVGLNYWVNIGGSTALWDQNRIPRKALNHITTYFNERHK